MWCWIVVSIDPARQLEVALVEAAVEDDRRLDEVDDLGQDAVRVGPAAEARRARRRSACAAPRVGLDVRGAQSLRVAGRVRRSRSARTRSGARTSARRRSSSSRASRAASARAAESAARSSSQRIVFENARPRTSSSTCSGQHLGERLARRPRRRGSRRAPRAPRPRRRGASQSPRRPSPASPPAGPSPTGPASAPGTSSTSTREPARRDEDAARLNSRARRRHSSGS